MRFNDYKIKADTNDMSNNQHATSFVADHSVEELDTQYFSSRRGCSERSSCPAHLLRVQW
jgi:hypothetical protein